MTESFGEPQPFIAFPEVHMKTLEYLCSVSGIGLDKVLNALGGDGGDRVQGVLEKMAQEFERNDPNSVEPAKMTEVLQKRNAILAQAKAVLVSIASTK